MLTPWKESYDQPRQHIQKQRHYFANKGLSSQGYGIKCSKPGQNLVEVVNFKEKEKQIPKNFQREAIDYLPE